MRSPHDDHPSDAIPLTPADAAGWAALWQLAITPWTRQADLAEHLGVARPTLISWRDGTRRGPWQALRRALLATARRHPTEAPQLAEALVRQLLDLRGHWVPDPEDDVARDWAEESEDVLVAHGVLARAVRQRDAAAVEAAAARLQRELDEAVEAARQALAAPPLVRAS
jgi:hypothetical protein